MASGRSSLPLQRARELEPDLVLLDVMMPKLDGISVLKELKADITLRFMPVILLTAKADTRDIVNGLGAGADDYLTKPFEQSALVARVRSLLRIKGLHDTVQLQAAIRSLIAGPATNRSPCHVGRIAHMRWLCAKRAWFLS